MDSFEPGAIASVAWGYSWAARYKLMVLLQVCSSLTSASARLLGRLAHLVIPASVVDRAWAPLTDFSNWISKRRIERANARLRKSVVCTYSIFLRPQVPYPAYALHAMYLPPAALQRLHVRQRHFCSTDPASIRVEAVPGFGTRGYAVPLFLLLCLCAFVPGPRWVFRQ